MSLHSFKLKIVQKAPPPLQSPGADKPTDIFSRAVFPSAEDMLIQLEVNGQAVNIGLVQKLELKVNAKTMVPELLIGFVVRPGDVDIDVDVDGADIFTEGEALLGCFGFKGDAASAKATIDAIEKPGFDAAQAIRDTLNSVSRALEPAGKS